MSVTDDYLANNAEYAKTFAKAGGIGLADHVYSALIAKQGEQGGRP